MSKTDATFTTQYAIDEEFGNESFGGSIKSDRTLSGSPNSTTLAPDSVIAGVALALIAAGTFRVSHSESELGQEQLKVDLSPTAIAKGGSVANFFQMIYASTSKAPEVNVMVSFKGAQFPRDVIL